MDARIGYRSVFTARSNGEIATAGSGAAHEKYDRKFAVDMSREYYRDNAIYAGMINRLVSYIIGSGFQLQTRTHNKEFNDQLEKLWAEFWLSPEIRGMSGKDVAEMVCREILLAGDCGVLKTEYGLLQLIEAEQIVSSANKYGIDIDRYGKPTAYYVAPYNENGYISPGEAQPVSPDDMVFVANLERPSSIRAVPPGQSSFNMLMRLGDILDSEVQCWETLSRVALAITRADAGTEDFDTSDDDEYSNLVPELKIKNFDGAMIFEGSPGDEVKGIDRNIPGVNFQQSLYAFLRMVGLSFGMPLEVLILDWSKSNYSQSRAVIEQAFQTIQRWQQKLVNDFFDRVCDWKIEEWVSAGVLEVPEDVTNIDYEWITPSFPWLDQLKEAQSQELKMKLGLATHAEVCAELGHERTDIVTARRLEIENAIEIAAEIKGKHGVDVDWRIFAGLESKDATASVKPEPEVDENDEVIPDDES